MTDSDPARQEPTDEPESPEEAVRRETEAARARAEAEIRQAREKGQQDA